MFVAWLTYVSRGLMQQLELPGGRNVVSHPQKSAAQDYFTRVGATARATEEAAWAGN
jgi:hypothetical protein